MIKKESSFDKDKVRPRNVQTLKCVTHEVSGQAQKTIPFIQKACYQKINVSNTFHPVTYQLSYNFPFFDNATFYFFLLIQEIAAGIN